MRRTPNYNLNKQQTMHSSYNGILNLRFAGTGLPRLKYFAITCRLPACGAIRDKTEYLKQFRELVAAARHMQAEWEFYAVVSVKHETIRIYRYLNQLV